MKRGTDSGRKNPAVKGSQAVDGRKSKKIRAYLEKEKDEIFVCEKPGRYYLMDAFLDVSESEFAERTAELINFMRTTAKASVMRLVTSSMQKMSDGRSMQITAT